MDFWRERFSLLSMQLPINIRLMMASLSLSLFFLLKCQFISFLSIGIYYSNRAEKRSFSSSNRPLLPASLFPVSLLGFPFLHKKYLQQIIFGHTQFNWMINWIAFLDFAVKLLSPFVRVYIHIYCRALECFRFIWLL